MTQVEKGARTRRQIVEASKRLFYEQGYEQTTFRQIAEATGQNQGSIHYHFGSKAALAGIVLDEAEDGLYQAGVGAFPEARRFEAFLIAGYVQRHVFFTDGSYRRFKLTAEKEGLGLGDKGVPAYYDDLLNLIEGEDSDFKRANPDSVTLSLVSFAGQEIALDFYLAAHLGEFSIDDIVRVDGAGAMDLYGIPAQSREDMLAVARERYHQLRITPLGAFAYQVERMGER